MNYKPAVVFVIILISVCCTQKLNSQDIQGTWMSKYAVRISENLSDQIDSSYSEASFLIHFLPDNQALLKLPLYRDYRNLLKGQYQFNGERITAAFDSLSLSLSIKGSELIFKDTLTYSYLVMKKVQPEGQLTSGVISESINEDSYWKMQVDTNSRFHGMEIYFISEKGMVIRQEFGPKLVTSSDVEFFTDSLDNSLLLALSTPFNTQKSVFRFFSGTDAFLKGEIYEKIPFVEEMKHFQIYLERLPVPSAAEYVDIKNTLLATWESKVLELPARSHSVYGFETIKKQYYSITFSDNERFDIAYGGDLIRDGVAHPDNKSYSGSWALAKTGNYLSLKYDDGTESLLSIIHLDESSISFCLDTQALGFQAGTSVDYHFQLSKR